MVPVVKHISIETFLEKFVLMEGIVEAFIEGEIKVSPSVQCSISTLGDVEIVSTHNTSLFNAGVFNQWPL